MRGAGTFVTFAAMLMVGAAYGATACTFLVSFEDADASSAAINVPSDAGVDSNDNQTGDATTSTATSGSEAGITTTPTTDADGDQDSSVMTEASDAGEELVTSATYASVADVRAGTPSGSTNVSKKYDLCTGGSLAHWRCLSSLDPTTSASDDGIIVFCPAGETRSTAAYRCPGTTACEPFSNDQANDGNFYFEDSCNPCPTANTCDQNVNSAHPAYIVNCNGAIPDPIATCAAATCGSSCTTWRN